jgi:hypothetical protein
MPTKKDLVIVVLATFCLTLTLFVAMPTRSSTASSSGYDPWIDINDDGWINAKDAVILGGTFGSSGDPTRNVIVERYNWSQNSYDIMVNPGEEGNISVITGGYKQITLGFRFSAMMPPPMGNISIAAGFLMGGTLTQLHVYVDRFNATPGWVGPELPVLPEYPVVKTYDVRGDTLTIAYYNPNLVSYRLLIEYYMTS